ncbi:AAA family ATPase [Microlunatus sp. Y2014]|uniref:AAA family ATPase n=1 Tax=Microlunatus sp. Y2014 TaxID=3418488 RepID=UPI003DA79C9E
MNHLVVLRGNSASGKTTLAEGLQRALGRGTANIGQDHLRRVILREHDVPDGDNIELIAHTVRYCLSLAYHVIVEGIFYSPHYGAMLRRLLDDHDGPCHVLYLDVPLEETIRRHRDKAMADVPEDKLREWFNPADLLGVPGEVVIDGRADQETVLAAALAEIGQIAAPRSASQHPARFL